MDLLIPWRECVYECAEVEKIDFGDAAYKVIQDLSDIRQYRQLGSLEKSIQQAHQQLTMLNIVILQKQQAISTLMTLQNRGVYLEEIYGLTKIPDLNRRGKQWQSGIGWEGQTAILANMDNDSGGNGTSEFKLDYKHHNANAYSQKESQLTPVKAGHVRQERFLPAY